MELLTPFPFVTYTGDVYKITVCTVVAVQTAYSGEKKLPHLNMVEHAQGKSILAVCIPKPELNDMQSKKVAASTITRPTVTKKYATLTMFVTELASFLLPSGRRSMPLRKIYSTN